MSLNHLVTGGATPPQDITVNDLVVEGTLTADSFLRTYRLDTFVYSVTGGVFVSPAPPLPADANMIVEVKNDKFVTFTGSMLIDPTDGQQVFEINIELPEGAPDPANQWMNAVVSAGNSGGLQGVPCNLQAAVYNTALVGALPACRLEIYRNGSTFGALDQYFVVYSITYEKA